MSTKAAEVRKRMAKARSERFREAREILDEVWRSLMGKTGLILIVFLVIVSIYALVSMPPNIVKLWNDPKAWEDNPSVVPPTWVSYFGTPVAPHVAKVLKPSQQGVYSSAMIENAVPVAGFVQVFSLDYRLDAKAFPQDIIAKIVDASANPVGGVQPIVTVYMIVKRPDGLVVMVNSPAPQPLKDIIAAGVIRLDPAQTAASLAAAFNISLTEAQAQPIRLLFGKLVGNRVEPLLGTYKIDLILMYGGVDPHSMEQAVKQGTSGIQSVKMIVKGSAYGLMGTDYVGHDLWLGLLFGFPAALAVGFFGAVTAALIGMIMGVISGYYGGWVDELIQRTVDVLGNIPLLPILVLIGVIVQEWNISPWARLFIIIGVLVLVSWGGLTIIVRSMVLSIKSEPYIEAAKAVGASNTRIMFRHIVPQILPYVFANLVFSVPAAILTEAGLSILGIRHGLPTWGAILSDAEAYVRSGGSYAVWWWILPPGILIGITSVAFVFLGLALETVVEPRLRRR
ncbi:ABC transporter permease [Pyrofollis japonicus]|uniref:ABC transporter permease n=1 Tax=Pyrofollis japonicus TaxID=3060460 RepID=UPI00295ABA9C|nr:ABC transporter permease [Pyrofollis japonicus]BEP17735.1 ABC transporter permease [Pyrofollis japonicus]